MRVNIATKIMFAALAGALSGCASTKLDNSPQEIALTVMPAMASCEAYQAGTMVGRYDPTRGAITVPKSPGRTDIVCVAPGYKDKRVSIAPGDGETSYRRYLTDLGGVRPLGYPAALEIALEPADRQGRPS
jgi:hypothetical protein